MDRRDFFKTLFATPLITPFLIGSHSSTNDGLFLINDRPATYLPAILGKLRNPYPAYARNYAFLNTHPQEKSLS